ncbi:unnamed protein product [Lactuca virosa]|uniref:Uncharacterized protein n=1 Tax=Lactuca virosa TaxID=75947 RepID=A0AAU9NFI5_9ASTR|nr:unnamed protein product [Lactuca virosa]
MWHSRPDGKSSLFNRIRECLLLPRFSAPNRSSFSDFLAVNSSPSRPHLAVSALKLLDFSPLHLAVAGPSHLVSSLLYFFSKRANSSPFPVASLQLLDFSPSPALCNSSPPCLISSPRVAYVYTTKQKTISSTTWVHFLGLSTKGLRAISCTK